MFTARQPASSRFSICERRRARALRVLVGLSAAASLWLPCSATAQISFAAPTSFPVGTTPRSVAVGDFNGDTDLDLAIANGDSDNVSVLVGAGDGSFTAAASPAAGDLPFSVAVGEFNGDGDPDLAVANRDSANVSVLLGAAGATFSGPTQYPAGVRATAVEVGDFNGDADPDLVVVNNADNDVSVLLGGTGGSFGAATDFAVGSSPRSVVVGNFDGDTDLDLAVVNSLDSNVSVLVGQGNGTFTSGGTISSGVNPVAVAAGRFNAGDDLDLVTANTNAASVSVLLGASGTGFGPSTGFAAGNTPTSVAVGDLDGDTDLDLVAANDLPNSVSVLPGAGDGTFGARTAFAAGAMPFEVAVGDLDGDGRPDVALANRTSNVVSVLLNSTNRAPVAGDDTYGTDEDVALEVDAPGLLSNDGRLDGDALTLSPVTGPGHGALALNDDGSFTYTPNADYNGPDAFTYRVSDGTFNSNTATVSLTVSAVNDAPSAGDDAYATDEDTPLTVAAPGVLGNDADTEGQALSPSLVSGPGHGALTLNADGSLTYTPEPDYNGADAFTYRDSDGTADSNTATVALTVTAVADAPPPAPARPAGNAPQQAASLRLGVAGRSVFAPTAAVSCTMASGPIDSCRVALRARGRLVARGTRRATGARPELRVALELTAEGRRMLTTHLGGMHARITAVGSAAGVTDTVTARTRALLGIERFTTPPGSWVPNQARLTRVGRRFVHRLRGNVIAVARARCEGHVAGERPGSGIAVSLDRARLICGELRALGMTGKARLVAHGNRDPIASNLTEAGRARNRRVEVTLRHRAGKLIMRD